MYSKSMLAILFMIPYGWTVVGALLMCWMVVQLDKRKDKKKAHVFVSNYSIVTYGDICPHKRTEGNRETWRNFFDSEDF